MARCAGGRRSPLTPLLALATLLWLFWQESLFVSSEASSRKSSATAPRRPSGRCERQAAGSDGQSVPAPRSVAVAGATGRTGQLVVQELLRSGSVSKVLALVRNVSKAAEVFGTDNPQIQTVAWDSGDEEATAAACEEADVAVWCAEGEAGLSSISRAFAAKGSLDGQPRLVMCSSAAVTRPSWSTAKKQQFPGVADIPIVRLNPNGILGKKAAAEEVVRRSSVPYAIVRPTGLNDAWPSGRPLLSQGDMAVGRMSRADLASLLVSLLDESSATGKTFEAVSVAGYPKPRSYDQALARLETDRRGPLTSLRRLVRGIFQGKSQAEETAYGLLQQLLPGESQDSAGLAMGQTYEQYDTGKEGRLGPRGEERVPASVTG
eukprot:TRINITY_DN16417_c0_g1_i1.p1 TRINITY_DN16417_c0_g1~~TRINITY_DN16417_c0_g1_i1.p1  ORF type:complete len:377 (+),score=61.87 TRINITY_DN16417_c0_g1_i1:27-1157(+)